jgi:hypothetical protein
MAAIDSIRNTGWSIVRSQYEEFEIVGTFKTKREAEKSLKEAERVYGKPTDCYVKKLGKWE